MRFHSVRPGSIKKKKLVSKVSEYYNIHLGMEALNQLTAHLTRCGLIFIDNSQTTNKMIQNKTQSGNHRAAILIITSSTNSTGQV